MRSYSPLCCTSKAFRLLSRQVSRIDSPDALLNGAVAIAMHQMEHSNPAEVDRQLQEYADTVRSRVRGSQPQALLANQFDVAHAASPGIAAALKGAPLKLIYVMAEPSPYWIIGVPGSENSRLKASSSRRRSPPSIGASRRRMPRP